MICFLMYLCFEERRQLIDRAMKKLGNVMIHIILGGIIVAKQNVFDNEIFFENGFTVKKLIEPVPTLEILEKYPDHEDLFHKPDFLLVRSVKQNL